jgi:hypothetical protein
LKGASGGMRWHAVRRDGAARMRMQPDRAAKVDVGVSISKMAQRVGKSRNTVLPEVE